MSKVLAKTNKDIDDSMLLGHMFFAKIPSELKISDTDLEQLLIDSNIDTDYLRKISKRDAFRRATSKVKGNISIDFNGDMHPAHLEVDEVLCDTDRIVRLLGRKLVDEKNQEATYETVGKFEYEGSTGNLIGSVNPIYASEHDYQLIIDETVDRYNEWTQFHTKETVKNITVRIIKEMYPINLLDTGLAKFIPITSKTSLFNLQDFVRSLGAYSQSDSSAFEVIPVLDTEEQRDTIYNQATASIKADMNDMVKELAEVIKTQGSLTTRKAASYIEKFKYFKTMIAEYESTVGAYMPVLNQQLVKALDYIEENKEEAI